MGKERERTGLRKKLSFLKKKIVHFLHFKTLYSIIIFMRCNAFLSHSVAVSFPTKVISIGISNSTPIPLFILVPVVWNSHTIRASEETCLTSCLGKEAHVLV